MEINLRKCISSVFVALVCISTSHACTPLQRLAHKSPISQRVENADVVVFGRVKARKPDLKYGHGIGRVYRLDFSVYCTYKGGNLPTRVRIYATGRVAGWCFSTNFEPKKEYIAFLTRSGRYLQPSAVEILVDKTRREADTRPLTRLCGLNRQVSKGKTIAMREAKCPNVSPSDSCFWPTTTQQTTTNAESSAALVNISESVISTEVMRQPPTDDLSLDIENLETTEELPTFPAAITLSLIMNGVGYKAGYDPMIKASKESTKSDAIITSTKSGNAADYTSAPQSEKQSSNIKEASVLNSETATTKIQPLPDAQKLNIGKSKDNANKEGGSNHVTKSSAVMILTVIVCWFL